MNIKKLLIPVQTVGLLALSTGMAFAEPDAIAIPRADAVKIESVGSLISAALGILLIIAAIAAFIFLILGGLQWITSGGDKAQLEAARGKITNAIIGLIVVAAAWAIMALVANFIGLEALFSDNQQLKIPKPF